MEYLRSNEHASSSLEQLTLLSSSAFYGRNPKQEKPEEHFRVHGMENNLNKWYHSVDSKMRSELNLQTITASYQKPLMYSLGYTYSEK